ncbi:carboxypeptidase M32 [Tautonia plasticadhaerens]|uniref:Metal-dependent carboxypeptidase n=1 Tax=Tautonia plasticadhaerens TaxID=2527974 RepID=A0A518GZH5_9BACT|nr:carboxypeptidase M32 [Tautonia plasticadhaerens]QDV33981.1 Thermostable carboxypeptidase 1 [Tautonia plasticadhaerens]
MDPKAAYDELTRRSREWSTLASCAALLSWDELTVMPTAASAFRGDQLGLLAGLEHERATDPKVGELLATVEGSDLVADPESPEAADVRELRRSFDRKTKLPRALVEELARVTSAAQHEWVAARKGRDFPRFLPWLDRIVALKRREAECVGAPGGDPYDALLDDYEPGASASRLSGLFDALKAELVPLVGQIASSETRPDPGVLRGNYPIDRQKMLGELVAASIGFDFDRGRLDTSAHPFCSGIAPGDCRITTRYRPDDFEESFFGVLHEVGHGLYEQGLDPDRFGTPMGESVSLGIHESQSRLWENLVGRGRAFWTHWFPIVRRLFREPLGAAEFDAFHRAVNRVEPSLIRTQADEVTYNLHIIIRFELERALLSGDLPPADLPGAWDESYRRDLGVVAPDVADGCLQDVHWSAGLFGYFPTYTLGNLYAAQLFDRASEELGDLDASIRQGDTTPLLRWLRDHVHRHARRHTPAALIRRATGSDPDHRPLIRSLKARYGPVYGLSGAEVPS